MIETLNENNVTGLGCLRHVENPLWAGSDGLLEVQQPNDKWYTSI